jgi:CRP-like cAMP-binding protein/predicted MFS family arabinose efflux permease
MPPVRDDGAGTPRDRTGRGPARSGTYRAALAQRQLRWLVVSFGLHAVVGWTAMVVLVVAVVESTGSVGWAGAITATRFVASLVASPHSGVLAERFGARAVLVGVNLAAATVVVVLAFMAAGGAGPLPVVAVSALFAFAVTPAYPATAAAIPTMVPERDLAAANGLVTLVENLSVFAGPAVAAGLLAATGPSEALAVNAVLLVLSAAAAVPLAALRHRRPPADVVTEGLLRQALVGFGIVGRNPSAMLLIGFGSATSLVYGVETVLLVEIGADRIDAGSEGYGLLMAALGVGGIVAVPLVTALIRGGRLAGVMSLGTAVYAAPLVLFVAVGRPGTALVIQVLRGAGTLVVDVLAATALQRAVAPWALARVFGVYVTCYTAATAVGAGVGALLLQVAGLDTTLVVVAAATTAAVLLALPATRGIDRDAAERLERLEPRIELLEGLGLLASASRLTLERLAGAAVELRVPAGDRIVTEGATADRFYVIASGTVQVSARGEGDVAQVLRTMGPGEAFGEIGLLQRIGRTASVDALEPATLLAIAGEDLLDGLAGAGTSSSFLDLARARLALTHPSHDWSDRVEADG